MSISVFSFLVSLWDYQCEGSGRTIFIFFVTTEVLKAIPFDAERASHIISWVFVYRPRGKYLKLISGIQLQIDTYCSLKFLSTTNFWLHSYSVVWKHLHAEKQIDNFSVNEFMLNVCWYFQSSTRINFFSWFFFFIISVNN